MTTPTEDQPMPTLTDPPVWDPGTLRNLRAGWFSHLDTATLEQVARQERPWLVYGATAELAARGLIDDATTAQHLRNAEATLRRRMLANRDRLRRLTSFDSLRYPDDPRGWYDRLRVFRVYPGAVVTVRGRSTIQAYHAEDGRPYLFVTSGVDQQLGPFTADTTVFEITEWSAA